MPRLVALLGLILLARAVPAAAQSPIHRCIGANGGAVFTDQPCAALRATPVNPAAPAADTPAPSGPPPVLCATSVDELRQSVIDAFTRRDGVRMGGLILWDGYGRGAAIADIRALTALMKQPLLAVDMPAPSASATASLGEPPHEDGGLVARAPATAPDQLILHTAGSDTDGASSTWRFDIVRQAGCLWLRNAN
ncbi:DUF4124 domain-containing protein [Rhodanobacter lindaniclasticus]